MTAIYFSKFSVSFNISIVAVNRVDRGKLPEVFKIYDYKVAKNYF